MLHAVIGHATFYYTTLQVLFLVQQQNTSRYFRPNNLLAVHSSICNWLYALVSYD